jgi:hypothetical protein
MRMFGQNERSSYEWPYKQDVLSPHGAVYVVLHLTASGQDIVEELSRYPTDSKNRYTTVVDPMNDIPNFARL